MEITSSVSNFRFRDHGNDMEEIGESIVGDTTSESTLVTSDEESDIESDELASMTAKGINHLCLELVELKQASEVDFQENIISNYSSFIRVFNETEGINNEVMQLKYHMMAQKQLVRNLMDGDCLKTLSDDPTNSTLDEPLLDDQNPTTIFKASANEVLETLDNLLFEHRLEEALEVFKTEDGNSPKVKFQEEISPDVWMCYKSDMAERRVTLADKLTHVADSTRVSAAELQKSLTGLSRLGFDHLATRLLLKYYHNRIVSGVNDLQSSSTYIHDLSKYVFSMMSQAAKSFVLLHGENSSYNPELIKWAYEEVEAFATRFNRHVESISHISGGLLSLVDSVHFAVTYCSLLERQKLVLRPCLVEHILPCTEGILKAHFDHVKKLISIFMSSDGWVMGRYLVSGMFTGGISSILYEQCHDYCLLTNSGRKFVSLLQDVTEDVSFLVSIMGSSIYEELVNLFRNYVAILERALTYETTDVIEGGTRIKPAESVPQKVSIIANISTLEHLFSSVIRYLFKDMDELRNVIDSRMLSVAGTCSRLRSNFCKKFVHGIMSNEASCIKDHIDSDFLWDEMPSAPYQILFLELRKVEELAEDNIVEFDWLVSLLTEVVETTFDWICKNGEKWMIHDKDGATDQQSDILYQFALDMQFLVEIARHGGYLTANMVNSSTDLISQMELAIVSTGFDLNRYAVDYKKVTNSAMQAIKELEALEEQKWHSDEDFDQLDEEYQAHSSNNSVEDDDYQSSSEVSLDTPDISKDKNEADEIEHELENEIEDDACEEIGSKEIKKDNKAEQREFGQFGYFKELMFNHPKRGALEGGQVGSTWVGSCLADPEALWYGLNMITKTYRRKNLPKQINLHCLVLVGLTRTTEIH
ncbi:cullin repeat-like-containing domain-containing protein [Artemisia annua]|uniref:Cullin repeat-like-containing domain-containing protein n=1 Tax=Artemisia annua TaxID=35608 RepID=A0A2U1NBF0_ARTAN|nr:cullin repeat-like-containing domain-containing protein [Artemisia annua]